MSTEKLAPHECASKEFLVWSILEPVGRLGSFSVMDHVNPIGFSISHHVYIARTVLYAVFKSFYLNALSSEHPQASGGRAFAILMDLTRGYNNLLNYRGTQNLMQVPYMGPLHRGERLGQVYVVP